MVVKSLGCIVACHMGKNEMMPNWYSAWFIQSIRERSWQSIYLFVPICYTVYPRCQPDGPTKAATTKGPKPNVQPPVWSFLGQVWFHQPSGLWHNLTFCVWFEHLNAHNFSSALLGIQLLNHSKPILLFWGVGQVGVPKHVATIAHAYPPVN